MRSVLILYPRVRAMIIATLLLVVVPSLQDTVSSARRPGPGDSSRRVRRDSVMQTLPSVQVLGTRKGNGYVPVTSRAAMRTLTPLRDVPQSITVLTAPVLRELGLHTMAQSVEFLPGITMGQGEGHRDAPTIRGQSTTADFFIDGIRDDAQYLRDNYNIDQLEAIKGANALAFGRGGGGGVINRVSKQAQWMPVRELRATAGSYTERRLTIDAGQPVTSHVAARVNGLYENSRSFRDIMAYEKFGFTPTIAFRSRRTLLQAGGELFRDRRSIDRGIPSANGRPSPAPIARYFGDPRYSRSEADVTSGFLLAQHETARGITVRSQLRAVAYDKFYENAYPNSAVTGIGSDAGGQVALAAYNSATDRHNLFNQTDVTWSTSWGAVRQTLLLGGEVSRQSTGNQRMTGYFDNRTTTRVVAFDDPRQELPVTFRASSSDANNRATARVAGAFVQEQLHLGPLLQLVGGIRVDRVRIALADHRTATGYERTDALVSPRVGVVVTPHSALSVYLSHGVSALPSAGDQFAALSATTQTLMPERFRNREVGAKWSVSPALEASAALYRLERSNSTAPDPLDASRLVQTGRQRTTGFELNVAGSPHARWNVLAGLAAQRARIVTRTSSAAAGASVPLVPHLTISAWNSLRLPSRSTAGLGVVHQGRRYAAIDNTVLLPAFTRVDASLSWGGAGTVVTARATGASLQLHVENLLNRRYFATSHGNNNIMPGAPRLVRLSLNVTP